MTTTLCKQCGGLNVSAPLNCYQCQRAIVNAGLIKKIMDGSKVLNELKKGFAEYSYVSSSLETCRGEEEVYYYDGKSLESLIEEEVDGIWIDRNQCHSSKFYL